MQKGSAPILIIVLAVAIFAGYLLSQNKYPKFSETVPSPTPSVNKGVIQLKLPGSKQEITSPLTVSGLVYGNNGTLTIKLKQKESGQYVTEEKQVKIFGKSDNISFAQAIQFGLPVQPQTGILEIFYKDESGKGLDDKVSIEVEFPSDLGKGK